MTIAAEPRWEWRAFAPSFDTIDPLTPPGYHFGHDTYILSESSNASAKLHERTIDVKSLAATSGGLELWRPAFEATFPICQRQVREVLALLGLPAPETYFEPEYTPMSFVVDLVAATPGAHLVGVHKTLRQTELDGCLLERTALCAAGHNMQTVAVSSADAAAVTQLVRRLGLEHLRNTSYDAFLKRMLGIRVPAPSEGARHEDPPLFPVRAPDRGLERAGLGSERRAGT